MKTTPFAWKHPNYQRWKACSYDRLMCDAWTNSFDLFNAAVGMPPSNGASLRRYNSKKPLGPSNFFWKELVEKEVDDRPKWKIDLNIY
jgi:hypothetical protein